MLIFTVHSGRYSPICHVRLHIPRTQPPGKEVAWRDRREGQRALPRSWDWDRVIRSPSKSSCIDHRIAMAKKWRVKESEWILAGVFKKMRCDLFCFLFFSSKIYLTLTYSYFEKYYWLPPLILNGKTTWGTNYFSSRILKQMDLRLMTRCSWNRRIYPLRAKNGNYFCLPYL